MSNSIIKAGDLVFVYGTLKRGQTADLSKNHNTEFVAEDAINGFIYDLGWYPGVKATSGPFDRGMPAVHGEVFRINDAMVGLALDAYEGYPGLYTRIETETAGGRKVWVYVYNHEVAADHAIPSGAWGSDSPMTAG